MGMKALIKLITPLGKEVDAKGTLGGILYTVPYSFVWTAKGYGYQTMSTSATASLIIRPSTLSALTLYNNTLSYFVIERAFAFNLVSITSCTFGIWLCSHPAGMTAPAGNNIAIRNSTNGKASATAGICDTAEAVADDGWFPWSEAGAQVVQTVPGSQAEAKVNGRIIVPPTGGISIQCVSNTAVVTCTHGFHYFVVPATDLVLDT